ncbi:MAG: hypothetical protein ACTSRP_26555, partial [Candidatus Helarchaeota archaeon]
LRKIYYDHDRYTFMNDLSLVALGHLLKDFSCIVVSHDYNLLKILNYLYIPCSYQMGEIIDRTSILNE